MDTRVLKYKGSKFAPLTNTKSVIDSNGNDIDDIINNIILMSAEGYKYMGIATIDTNPLNIIGKVFYIAIYTGTYVNFNNIEVYNGEICILKYDTLWSKDVVYFNLLDNKKKEAEGKFSYTRKDTEGNELYPKTLIENIYDLKGNKLEEILATKKDYIFDATELYSASETDTGTISELFKANLLHAINDNKVLFASVKIGNAVTTALITFINHIKDTAYFTAIGRDYRYTLTLNWATRVVIQSRQPISAPFNRYITEQNGDIFHIETTATNTEIQKMLTTDKGEVLIPNVGDVFELYDTTDPLKRVLHYSGIVTSRVEENSVQDIILFSNDLVDDFFMIHHIKLEYDKDKGLQSLKIAKAYHMIIDPYDLEMNNRNVIFNNVSGNSIFNLNSGTPVEQLKPMFNTKSQLLMLPHVGDMFVAYQEANGKELSEAGIVISEYDNPTSDGFIVKIISNNFEFGFWTLHSVNFAYNAKQGFDSLKVKDFMHTVIDPELIEHTKLSALYADVENLKNNSNMINSHLDSINGENGEVTV